MANNVTNVAFTNPSSDYASQLAEIQRSQALAEALQAQSMAPGGATRMAGNIAIKNSPWEGIAKGAQALSSQFINQQAKSKQEQLAAKSQADMTRTLTDAMQAYRGSPATAAQPDPSGDIGMMQTPQAAVSGDPMQAAMIMMRNPQTAQMGMPMFQDAIRSQKLAAALAGAGYGGSQAPAAPQSSGSTGAPAPQAGVTSPAAAPAGGVPRGVNPLAWQLAIASGDVNALAKLAQEGYKEDTKPIVGREGAPVLERGPDGQLRPSFYIPRLDNGIQPIFGPGGATSAQPVPGYNDARAATIRAEEGARQGVQAGFDLVDVPDGQGGTIKMPRAQALARLSGAAPAVAPIPAPPPAPAAGMPSAAQQPTFNGTAATFAEGRAMADRLDAQRQPFNIRVPGPASGAPPAASVPRETPPGVPQLVPGITPQGIGTNPSPAALAADKIKAEDEAKRAAGVPEARMGAQSQLGSLDRIVGQINQVMNNPALSKSVGLVGAFPSIPGSDAAGVDAIIDGVKAQLSVSGLQSIRDASKTGGAVGAVTEKEWPRLESLFAALDKKMSPELFRQKLGEIVREIQVSKRNIQQAYDSQFGAANGPIDRAQQPPAGASPGGWGIKRVQ